MKKFIEYIKSLQGFVFVDLTRLIKVGLDLFFTLLILGLGVWGVKSCSNKISNIFAEQKSKEISNNLKVQDFKNSILLKKKENQRILNLLFLAESKYQIKEINYLIYLALMIENSHNQVINLDAVNVEVEEINQNLVNLKIPFIILKKIDSELFCHSSNPSCSEFILFLKEQEFKDNQELIQTSFSKRIQEKDLDFLLVYKKLNPQGYKKFFQVKD